MTSVADPVARREPAWAVWAIAAALLAAVATIYGQTLRYGFLTYDDSQFVRGNPLVTGGLTAAGFRAAMISGPMGEWYPLSMISHMLDCQVFGLDAWGHHLINVVLHAATTLGLFFVLRRMTGETWPSALATMLFAVHPQHVESVAWIAERRDVLSGFFFVLTLAAYLGYVRHGRSLGRYLLVAAMFALGLMSKATLVTVPALLLLLDYWPLGRYGRAAGIAEPATRQSFWWLSVEKLPLLALAAGDCLMTVITHIDPPGNRRGLAERLANAVVSPVEYLRQAFYPADLAAFYPFPVEGYPLWKVAGSIALLALLTIAALVWRRRCPYLLVGWLWFLGMFLPVIGLLRIAEHARADRYSYLPQIGLCIALSWGATRLAGASVDGRWAVAGCAALLIATLIGCSIVQTTYWHDDLRLWARSLAITGSNGNAERALADALSHDNQLDEAIEHYRLAAKWGLDLQMANNLGIALARQHRLREAIEQFQAVLNVHPDSAPAHANLGWMLDEAGLEDEAALHYGRSIELDRFLLQPRHMLAQMRARQGRNDEAIAQLEQLIVLAPRNADYHAQLAGILSAQGRSDEAIAHYRQALQLAPNNAAARQGLDQLLGAQPPTR